MWLVVSLELHWHDHVRPQAQHIFYNSNTLCSRKTQPKKNADWFCEKCKGQMGNTEEVGLEIDLKGLKANAWQTPAQRKAYSGQPTVNPAKTKVNLSLERHIGN